MRRGVRFIFGIFAAAPRCPLEGAAAVGARNWPLPPPDRIKRRHQPCGRRGLPRATDQRPCTNRHHTASH